MTSVDPFINSCKNSVLKLLNETNFMVNKSSVCNNFTILITNLRNISSYYVQIPLMHVMIFLCLLLIFITIYGKIQVWYKKLEFKIFFKTSGFLLTRPSPIVTAVYSKPEFYAEHDPAKIKIQKVSEHR